MPDESPAVDTPAQAAQNPQPAKKPWTDYFPQIGVWITWTIAITIVVLVRCFPEHLGSEILKDQAVANGLTAGGIFACGLALYIWFIWNSGFEFAVRRTGFIFSIVAFLFVVSCVRVNFDGSLVPHFYFVWNPLPDQLLEAPVQEVAVPRKAPALQEEVGFPQFLGPNRDATMKGPKLGTDWQAKPPKLKWRQPIGAGWAAFAAHSGLAVTLEQRGDDEWVTCYEVETGKVLWSFSVKGRHTEAMGGVGPRSTPTIDLETGFVYTLGANGDMHCVELYTGQLQWKQSLLDAIGVKSAAEDQNSILWGRSASPLIYKDLMIIPAGGPANGPMISLLAFDKRTGVQVWAGGSSQASYSSPTIATLLGKEQILIVNEASVAGHDPDSGKELWNFQWFGSSTSSASASQPHAVNDHQVFISKAYTGGMKLLEVAHDKDADVWSVGAIVENPRAMKTKFTNVAILGDYAYGLSDTVLECVNWHTGESQWKKGRYGQGQLLAVNDLLLIQCESGEVALVEARPDKYNELTRFSAIEGITWNNPCLYGNLLLVRNGEEAACYELPLAEDSDTMAQATE